MPTSYWIATLVSQSMIVPGIVYWARWSGLTRRLTTMLALVLGSWLAGAYALARAGVFQPAEGRPPVIGLAIVLPIVVGGYLIARNTLTLAPKSLAVLAGLQVVRSVGFEFVTASYSGHVPSVFGLPAGWGDLAIGVTAPFVAWAILRQTSGWKAIAVAWNVAGIADLVNAVTLGMIAAPGVFQLLETSPTSARLTELPLSLVPTFGVPLAVVGHMIGLYTLLLTSRATRTPRLDSPAAAAVHAAPTR